MIAFIALLLQSAPLAVDSAEAGRVCPRAYDVAKCMAARQAFTDAFMAVRECRRAAVGDTPYWSIKPKELSQKCAAEQFRCVGAFFAKWAAYSKNPDLGLSDAEILDWYRQARDQCFFNWHL